MGRQLRLRLALLAFSLTASVSAAPSLIIWEADPQPLVAKAGDLVEYRIAFSNTSDESAFALLVTTSPDSFLNRIRSSLPPGAAWVSGIPAPVKSTTWATSTSGPWNSFAPLGQMSPHYARWILEPVGMRRSGYIRYCVTIMGGDCQTLTAGVTASLYTTPGAPLLTASTAGYCAGRLRGLVTASPATIYTDQSTAIRFTVSNVGGVAVTGSLPEIGFTSGAGLFSSPAGPTPTGPLTILPGAATVFVWTATGVSPGTAVFSVSVSGASGAGTTSVSRTVTATVLAPALFVTATSRTIPAVPVTGGAVTYALSVKNSGTATIFSLEVTDTVPSVITVTASDQPAGFSLLAATVPGGTRFEWTASTTGLFPPGSTFTFTLTGYAPATCAPVVVTPAAVLTAASDPGTTNVVVAASPFTLWPPSTLATVSVTRAPSYQAPGGPVTLTIVITNTGSATLDALTLIDTLHPALTAVATAEPALLGVPVVTSEPTGTRYVWSAAAAGLLPPGASLTVTISGTIGVCSGSIALGATAWLTAASSCDVITAVGPDPGFDPCTPEPPGAPAMLTALGELSGIRLGWATAVPGAAPISAYAMWRGSCAGCAPTPIGTASDPATTFTDAAATAGGVTWYYRVQTIDTVGQTSGFSPVAAGTAPILQLTSNVMVFSPDPPVLCRDINVRTRITNTGNVTLTVIDESHPALMSGSAYAHQPDSTYCYFSVVAIKPGESLLTCGETFHADALGPITLRESLGINYDPSASTWGTRTIVTGPPGTPPDLEINVNATPASGPPGTLVTYRCIVTNIGPVTARRYMVFDTVPLLLESPAIPELPFGKPAFASLIPLGGGATGVVWTPGQLWTIDPGESLTVTLTGIVAASPGSTTIWNSWLVTAESADVCVTGFNSLPVPFYILPRTSVAVSYTRSPAAPTSGGPVTYRIVVANDGTATLVALEVVDTLHPIVTGIVTDQPAPLGAAIITSEPSGTRFVWTATAPNLLPPGASFTITISGTIGVCGGPLDPLPGSTAWISVSSDLATVAATALEPGFNPCLPSTPNSLTALAQLDGVVLGWLPSVPSGAPISAYAIWRASCMPCGSISLGTATGTTFSDTSVTTGGLTWWYHVEAIDTAGAHSSFSSPADATTPVLRSIVRSLEFTIDPPTRCRVFQVNPIVTNTGNVSATIWGIGATPVPDSGALVDLEEPVPSLPATLFELKPGMSAREWGFYWRATDPGTVTFSSSMLAVTPDGSDFHYTTYSESRTIGAEVPATPPALSVIKTSTPTVASTGDAITYRIVLTNVGAVTARNIMVFDTVPLVIQGIAQQQPTSPSLSSAIVPLPGGLTGVRWSQYLGDTFLPGATLTLTITGVVGASAGSTTIWNAVHAQAATLDACALIFASAPAPIFLLPPPPSVEAQVAISPAAVGPGESVSYRILVRNTGLATVTSLSVIDTVSPLLVDPVVSQPAGFPVPTVTSVLSGTRFEWSATGPGLLPPGAALTFTVTGASMELCIPLPLTNTVCVVAGNPAGTTELLASATPGLIVPATTAVSVVLSRSPTLPSQSGPVVYHIVVANTGSATLTSVTIVDTIHPLVTGVLTDQPTVFGVPAITDVASGTRYVWSAVGPNLLAPGGIFTLTLTGTMGICPGSQIVGATPWVVVASTCSLAEAVASDPGFNPCLPSVPGALTALGQASGMLLGWSPSLPAGAPISGYEIWRASCAACPPTPLGIAPWPATNFNDSSATTGGLTWWYTIRGADTTGLWSPFTPSAPAFVPILRQVTRAIVFSPDPPVDCRDFYVMAITTNTGNVPFAVVQTTDDLPSLISGTPYAVLFDPGVIGALTPSLPPGGSITFWGGGYRPTGLGLVTFSATMVDVTPGGTAFCYSVITGSRTIITAPPGTPPTLSVMKTVTPPMAAPGTPITYRIVLTNIGAVTAVNFELFDTVSSIIQDLAVPAPPSPPMLASLISLPGGATGVRWTPFGPPYLAPGVSLTVTITGVVAQNPGSATAWNSGQCFAGSFDACRTEFLSTPSALYLVPPPPACTIALQRFPASVSPGGELSYAIVLRNTGMTTITSLVVIDTVSPMLTGVLTEQPPGIPAPTIVSVLSGTRFEWSASGSTLLRPGGVFTFTITGFAGAFCTPATISNTVVIHAGNVQGTTTLIAAALESIYAPASTGVSVILSRSPSSPTSTGTVSYRIVITNTGAATLSTLTLVDTLHPMVTVTQSDQPAALGVPTVTPTATGTRYVWSGAAPELLPPGGTFTVTITGIIGACAGPVIIGATPWVVASSNCDVATATSADPGFDPCGPVPPGPPGALTAGGSLGAVMIGWSVAPPGANAVSAYEIWRATCAACGPALLGSVPDPATTFVDALVTAGGWIRFYSVRAVDTAALTGPLAGPVMIVLGPPSCATCVSPPAIPAFVNAIGGMSGYVRPDAGERAAVTFRPSGAGIVRVRIYTLAGRLVRELSVAASAGQTDTIHWDARDDSGAPVPPGVYPLIVDGPGISLKAKFGVLR